MVSFVISQFSYSIVRLLSPFRLDLMFLFRLMSEIHIFKYQFKVELKLPDFYCSCLPLDNLTLTPPLPSLVRYTHMYSVSI